jgi:hypothetical protein
MIYLIGIVISFFLLLVLEGYNSAKGSITHGPVMVMFMALLWPIMLPFFIGAWLAGREK